MRFSPSRRTRRRRAAWAVPVVTVAAVATAGLFQTSAAGSGHPKLAPKSAAQLLVALESSNVQALSGTVVQTTRLGLPSLPSSGHSTSMSWQSLVTGSHTARVWFDGPTRQRVALLGQLAESDVVRNGRDLWTYTSGTNAATHAVLPDRPAHSAPMVAPTDPSQLTPQAAAQSALAAIDPTTLVSVNRTAVVAGRPVYTLRLAPRDARSTIREVLIAVDSRTSVPLRVQVFGSGSSPAFETAFTDVSFSRPKASVFTFTPPRGAKVTTRQLSGTHRPHRAPPAGTQPAPRVIGAGWTSILEFTPTTPATTAPSRRSATGLLDQLTTRQANGDRVLRTPLVNALLTKDGRVFVGAVGLPLLEQAANGPVG